MKVKLIWMIDAIYFSSLVGQGASLVACFLNQSGRLFMTANSELYDLLGAFLIVVIMSSWISIALGALSFFSSDTKLPTNKKAIGFLIVCFFPGAFFIHYCFVGRRFLREKFCK